VNGIVIYQLNGDGQTLKALWYHSILGSNRTGTGTAKRIDGNGYEGSYDIVYQTPDGIDMDTLRLTIMKQGEVYYLQWHLNGKLSHQGLGIVNREGLSASWNPVPNESERR